MQNTRVDSTGKRILNFSAGPGLMPQSVLETAAAEMLNFSQGHSLMELSHRSGVFEGVLAETEAAFRRLLSIPSNYKVLFSQGGATTQFSMAPLNLAGSDKAKKVDYIVTGAWSSKAAEEAARLIGKDRVNTVLSTKKSNHNGDIPQLNDWSFSKDPAYVFYCDNETVHGVEFKDKFPFHLVPANVPIVCDMSSNILSTPVDVSKFGVIFAGAQKNMGPAGITVTIVREDLLAPQYKYSGSPIPLLLDFNSYSAHDSMLNTPPTFPIYICGLIFKWLEKDIGGLSQMAAINAQKADLLYSTIESSNGFYSCPVAKPYRSRMNVPFLVKGGKGGALETLFLKEAEEKGMIQLAGHRSVGGIRASLYNAMPLDGVQVLVDFMKEF
ncbi:phosphoserine aminotransferase, partial [Rhizoclosmatium globosum]